ncbi:hypothetical protein RAC89_03650 [Paenibacillus sp. GD4]|jgi:hypothetical protein|uniref:hypothetical protein n=1 Tax=Paenibacillus sp. GD4 TaxID=3068890 RepID=UPI0027964691|nr:hypothetical protein [Paenibacillus sp. GD4]MDQ1909599.1 hypothetical protein [Paenibacillus sp. GD4]
MIDLEELGARVRETSARHHQIIQTVWENAERLQMNYELARTKLEQMRKLKQELRSLRNL